MRSHDSGRSLTAHAGEDWKLRPLFRVEHVLLCLLAVCLLGWSAHRVDLPQFFSLTTDAVLQALGQRDSSQVGDALARSAASLLPLQMETAEPLSRLADPNELPSFSHIEERAQLKSRIDPDTLETTQFTVTEAYVVRPFGYLLDTLLRMAETVEMGLWGTLFGALLSLPLAYGSARSYAGSSWIYHSCRCAVAFLRAIPELISALFLVLAYGFGPIAGILAMGLHCAGFFGKFFAEDIENADPGPQEAVRATGAGRLLVLRHAVLPQVLPQYVAYVLYILDRNVRTATVIGLVGAGGIGQELKGRFDVFEYAHVATILMVIFLTVLAIERLAVALRARLIGASATSA